MATLVSMMAGRPIPTWKQLFTLIAAMAAKRARRTQVLTLIAVMAEKPRVDGPRSHIYSCNGWEATC